MVQQTINLYAWRENEKMIPPVLITQGESDTRTAVSYTHLDVYKRQVPRPGDPAHSGNDFVSRQPGEKTQRKIV